MGINPSLALRRSKGRDFVSRRFRGAADSLYRAAYAVTRDHHLAEDVLQEAYLRIQAQQRTLESHPNPDAWMHRVAINLAIDAKRKEGRSQVGLPAEATRPTTSEQRDEDAVDLWMTVSTLGDLHRAVLILHYVGDFGVRDIALIYGRPQGTVKSWLHRARRDLHRALTADQEDEE